ncbi:Hpt domain-containing protein [Paroceanicella profunda]|uniref:Hpt domain-containing protein n=1 Tax=Paroceanicella profunda TaxID=2579971 RepID=A0A5B8FH44_9RHOB|nr:Hpt domain-containing protein [Paroceanicella profunda]QDL91981.1 Hpt domain-containing protein [Paroceanicella profunda]
MTVDVLRLDAREESLLDGDMIRVLRATLGHDMSQELMEDASFQLAERLSRLEQLVADHDLPGLHRLAHGLTGLAGQVGLMQLSSVSRALADCARRGDHVAVPAVAARLVRLGEESLFSLAGFID